MEKYKVLGPGRRATKKVRIPDGCPVFVGLAKYNYNEKFCVLPDKRISPLIQPNMVLGWRNGRLVLVGKDSDQKVADWLIFSELEPSIP